MTDTATAPLSDPKSILSMFHIDPDIAEHIDIGYREHILHIFIRLRKVPHICPICQTRTVQVSNYVTKTINHSVINTAPCVIDYHARRFKCHCCNKTFYENNPFSNHGERSSVATVYLVLQDLKKITETYSAVAQRYHMSTSTVINIFDSHVSFTGMSLPEYLSIDEVFIPTDEGNRYLCVLIDFRTQQIVDILPSRKKDYLISYFSLIPREERLNVKLVSSDMWNTYQIVAQTMLPASKFCVDRFHLLQELSRQFNHVRIAVMNSNARIKEHYRKTKRERVLLPDEECQYRTACINYYALKKFSWLFYPSSDNLLDPNREKKYNRVFARYMNFSDIYDYIIHIDSDLEEMIDFKYAIESFYKTSTLENARDSLSEIISMHRNSHIKEIRHYAGTLAQWKEGIVNSFTLVDGKRINNSRIEGVNKKLKTLKRNANGFKNFERFKTRAAYCINNDAGYSLTPVKRGDDRQ